MNPHARRGIPLLAIAALLPALLAPRPAKAADPSAQDIVARSLQAFYYPADDMRARVSMTLTNAQGKERRRDLTMLRRDFGAAGDQRYFVYFHAPADVRGITFMVWKYSNRGDDRWIFIPSVNMVRRIAANDKRSSFVGSDFTYEDVSGRSADDETHRLLRSESPGGRPCWVIESDPRASADYARRVSWIDKERWLPLKEEYYDSRGQKVREFTADEVREMNGHWAATKRTMKNLQTGHRTEVTFTEIAYDVGIEEDLFAERYLRVPPRRWIH